jgi:hypothetical protein
MKRLLVSLLAASTLVAHADNFAETDNQNGGKIIIMTDACDSDKNLSRAFFYTRDGVTEDGCWKYDAETVVITWEKQGKRRYPIGFFSLMNGYRKFKAF